MVLRRLDYLEFYNALTHQAWIIWIKDPSEIEITYKILKTPVHEWKEQQLPYLLQLFLKGQNTYKHYVDVQGENLPKSHGTMTALATFK